IADAGGAPVLQALNCSVAGNYTPAGAYAANLDQLLAVIPNETDSLRSTSTTFEQPLQSALARLPCMA
ncbi:hypothetical protein ABZP36_011389, partial [Zizania latifolia]